MELLDLLARAAPDPVDRYELSERLEVSLEMLYRLVYRLRSRLGERAVLRVGRSTTRHGKTHGLAGYRLTRPFEPFRRCPDRSGGRPGAVCDDRAWCLG